MFSFYHLFDEKNRYAQILRLTFASAADFFPRKLFGVMEKCFYLCLYKTT